MHKAPTTINEGYKLVKPFVSFKKLVLITSKAIANQKNISVSKVHYLKEIYYIYKEE